MDAIIVETMKYIEATTSVNGETSLDIDICVVIYFGIWSRAHLIKLVEHDEVNLLVLRKQQMRKWEW